MKDAVADAGNPLLSGKEGFGAEFEGLLSDETFEIVVGKFFIEGADAVEIHVIVFVVDTFFLIEDGYTGVHLDSDVEEGTVVEFDEELRFGWFGLTWFVISDVSAVAKDDFVVFGGNFDIEVAADNVSDFFANQKTAVFFGILIIKSELVAFKIAFDVGNGFAKDGFT